jgi:hypothetical protein
MSEKTKEYEIGKRHLAKMMGIDIELFSENKKEVQRFGTTKQTKEIVREDNKSKRFDLSSVDVG